MRALSIFSLLLALSCSHTVPEPEHDTSADILPAFKCPDGYSLAVVSQRIVCAREALLPPIKR